MNERLNLYLDENIKKVELNPLTVKPKLIFFADVSENADLWTNKAVERYYNKDTVFIKNK